MNWKTSLVSLGCAMGALAGDDFKSAGELYDAGKYADAAAVYEKIAPPTAAVFFNLGNAHFRLESLGHAVLDYERARQLAPRDPDILANLRFAEERLGVADSIVPTRPVVQFWESVAGSRTIRQWSWAVVSGVWLTVFLMAGAIGWPRWRTGLVIGAVVAGGGLTVAAGALTSRVASAPTAIVVARRAEARFAPLADATVHFQLGEGTKVRIREDRGHWWHVERADGQQGWIKADTAERVIIGTHF